MLSTHVESTPTGRRQGRLVLVDPPERPRRRDRRSAPTATVHRTDSASAPGTAPYGSRSEFCCTIAGCWVRFAPMPSGWVSSGAAGGHVPVTRSVSYAA
jgi:hypothetical protein